MHADQPRAVRRLRVEAAVGHQQRTSGRAANGQGSVATATVGTQTTVTIQVFWDDTVAQSTFKAAAGTDTQSITLETVL